jgi:hypothetical protein
VNGQPSAMCHGGPLDGTEWTFTEWYAALAAAVLGEQRTAHFDYGPAGQDDAGRTVLRHAPGLPVPKGLDASLLATRVARMTPEARAGHLAALLDPHSPCRTCGRPNGRHPAGMWSPCAACGRNTHRYGTGGQPRCPDCSKETA